MLTALSSDLAPIGNAQAITVSDEQRACRHCEHVRGISTGIQITAHGKRTRLVGSMDPITRGLQEPEIFLLTCPTTVTQSSPPPQ